MYYSNNLKDGKILVLLNTPSCYRFYFCLVRIYIFVNCCIVE